MSRWSTRTRTWDPDAAPSKRRSPEYWGLSQTETWLGGTCGSSCYAAPAISNMWCGGFERVPEDSFDLVELRLAADQWRCDLDDGVFAVIRGRRSGARAHSMNPRRTTVPATLARAGPISLAHGDRLDGTKVGGFPDVVELGFVQLL